MSRTTEITTLLFTVLVTTAATTPADAVVTVGESSGYGIDTNIIFNPAPALVLVDEPTTGNIAPIPYNVNANQASSHAESIFNLETIGESSTGELDINASSNVDGGLGVRSASADSNVDAVSVQHYTQALPLNPVTFDAVLDLQATQIASTADVTGDFGALAPIGTASLLGTDGAAFDQASINVLGTEFLLEKNPAPNTAFTINPGDVPTGVLEGQIHVIQNEQMLVGDGATNQSISVNALHIFINSGMIKLPPNQQDGAWTGEIIIGHSFARLLAEEDPAGGPAAPEPSAFLLATLGVLLGGGVRLGRHRK